MGAGTDEGAQHIDKLLFLRTELKSFKCVDVLARGNSDLPSADPSMHSRLLISLRALCFTTS